MIEYLIPLWTWLTRYLFQWERTYRSKDLAICVLEYFDHILSVLTTSLYYDCVLCPAQNLANKDSGSWFAGKGQGEVNIQPFCVLDFFDHT